MDSAGAAAGLAQAVFESVRDYAIFTSSLDGIVTSWNPGAQRLLGFTAEEIIGQSCDLIFTPEDRARGAPERERETALRDGRAEDRRWHLRKDGTRFWGSGMMMRLTEAETPGFVKILRDETVFKEAEEQRLLLINELNHRVKNTLATVQSISAQTLRAAHVDPAVQATLEGRLTLLSEAHNILTRESWEGAGLLEIVSRAVAPLGGQGRANRLAVDGANVWVTPRIALALSLALHELATNAVKYGALSVPGGQVSVRWSVTHQDLSSCLELIWEETGGPPVQPPTRQGFGTRLIQQGLSRELNGEARLEYRPEGLRCRIKAPLEASVAASEPLRL